MTYQVNQKLKQVIDVICWLVVSFFLIFTAAILLVKVLLPYADEYRHQIESNLSQVSGYYIQIDKITAKLEGLDPSFSLYGLSVQAEGGDQPLRFERLMIRLNFCESLKRLDLNFSYIRLYQTKLSLSEVSGRWSLTGLPIAASQNTGGFARILNYFLDQRQISLVDTQVAINSERIGAFALISDAMYLQRTQTGIGISANLHHENYDDEFQLNAEIQGDLRDLNSLKFVAELDVPMVTLTPTEMIELKRFKLSKVDLGSKLWLSYSANSDFSLVGEVELLPEFSSGETLSLNAKVNSRYSLETKKLNLQLSELLIEREGLSYPATNLRVEQDFNLKQTDIRFDHLDLAFGVEMALPYLNDDWFVSKMLAAMSPQGEAQNGHLKIETKPALSVTYLGNLAIRSSYGYQNIPSIKNLDAVLAIDNVNGSVQFASNNANLAFPLLYDDTWSFEGVSGKVEWGSIQDAFVVSADDLYLNRNGADLEGDFRLEVVKNGADTLALDIHADQLGIEDGLSYIPNAALPQSAFDWLENALRKGQASQADFVLQTELAQGAKPQFLVDLDVANAEVKFAPDWPVAEDVVAGVLIDRSGLDLDLGYAKLDQVESNDLTLRLPFDSDGLSELRLAGRLDSNLKDVMSLLLETDLATSALSPFRTWEAVGPAKGEFSLVLPLKKGAGKEPYFNLALNVADTRLYIGNLGLSGEISKGQLYYDSYKGIYDSSFDVNAFSGRAKVELIGELDTSNSLLVRTNIKGSLDLQEVMVWQKLPDLLTTSIQGDVDFTAAIEIDPSSAGSVKLTAETTLEGASVSLPVPFSKTAKTKKPFSLVLEILPELLDVTIQYDENYRSKLRFKEDGFYAGHALINEPDVNIFNLTQGLSLQGQLSHVELAAWRKLFNQPDKVSASPQGLRLDIPKWLSFVHLISDQVRLNEDNLLHNVKVEYDREKLANDIFLSSEEISLQLTKDLNGPVVNFSYLSWDSAAEDVEPSYIDNGIAEKLVSDRISAEQIPSMTLNIHELVINDKPYGDWHFFIKNLGKKLRIDPISTQLNKGKFVGSLFWQDDEHSNVELQLAIEGKNIDELTRKFSPEALLTSDEYLIDVNLSWLGTPFDIQRETLSGRIDFTAKKGILEKINELPSFLKALGIFNIHALARRLTLDFSDVSSDGLTYDKVSTKLMIQDGLLMTDGPLKIVSPTVEIELQGQADLVTETLDEKLTASFPLGNALPIAGFLLGMPQVAGVLYITDKIFGDQLSKVTSVEYLIKGPFANPEITPVIHTPKKNPKNRDK